MSNGSGRINRGDVTSPRWAGGANTPSVGGMRAENEKLRVELDLLRTQFAKVRAEALREAVDAVSENRLYDNTGDPEDVGYAAAIEDSIVVIRALAEGVSDGQQ